MLTDYHVHLRPDDDGTPASDYFTSANAERYRTVAEERGIAELGVAGIRLSLDRRQRSTERAPPDTQRGESDQRSRP